MQEEPEVKNVLKKTYSKVRMSTAPKLVTIGDKVWLDDKKVGHVRFVGQLTGQTKIRYV